MRKRAILALILAAALVLATSCSLIVKDAEVDKQTVIIEVAGKTFTKGEIAGQVEYQLAYQQYMYSMMYGYDIDITSADAISGAQDAVIESLVRDTVIDAKAAELGFDKFTDEELAQMQTEVDETYQSNFDSVKSSDFSETELTGEELDKAITDKLAELGYPDKETLLTDKKNTKAIEKLKADVVKDVAVTDEEIQAKYDESVATAMQTYASNAAGYGSDVTNGSTIYYTPAGYRYVKHILRKFLEADQTAMDELQSRISEKQTQLTNVEGTLSELGTDESADTEEKAAQRKDLTATKATLDTEIADLQAKLDAATEAAYAALQPTVDEIQLKITEGGDFDTLMAEYGEDPGMQRSPSMDTGYAVSANSTNWVAPFKEAAMALAAIGDVSEPVRTTNGIHIIKYVSDATEGATPLAELKDEISSELLTQKQDELYDETVNGWVEAAGAKIYKDRLAD